MSSALAAGSLLGATLSFLYITSLLIAAALHDGHKILAAVLFWVGVAAGAAGLVASLMALSDAAP